MFTENRLLLIWVVLLVLQPSSDLFAAEKVKIDKQPMRLSIEYFHPAKRDRNITTININAYYPVKDLNARGLSVYAGLTATHAYGDIIQLEGDLGLGTLREVQYDNVATGAGPVILTDLCLLSSDQFSLKLDASGGIIFYNKDFPAGGDRYNFMWRAGPVLNLTVGDGQNMGIGYRWMHVSNGQGLGPQNPSYDAQGFSLQYSFIF